MTGFLVGAALVTVLVLALLLRPLLFKASTAQLSQRLLNTTIYREQLAKLEQDLADGTLAKDDFAQSRAELQRRALEDTREEDASAALRAPKKTMLALGLLVPIAAVGLYLLIGNPGSMSADGLAQRATPADVERMVQGLAEKLEKEPGNLKGWAMLARSYKVMGRPVDAEKAFERSGSFIEDDAQLLASYADVAATNAGGNFSGKPTELIGRALKIDPDNGMALWLAGTAAFNADDPDGAIRMWERLAKQLPPGSEDANTLQAAIQEARAKGGKSSTVVAAAPAAGSGNAKVNGSAGADASGASVSGTVELDAGLKAKARPEDTVMVIARVPGTRMPVAVLRVRSAQLPMKFKLDDSLSMSPQARLSAASEVEVEARISKSGLAMPESGDLFSPVQTVKVGASKVTLRVAQVRP